MSQASTITATFGSPVETKAASATASVGLSDYAAWTSMFGGLAPIAGPAVNPTSAMSVPVVKACVELIAGAIGSLPVKVYRSAANGGRDEATDHPAFDLVHDFSSDFQDAGQLRQQLVVDALLRGAGFGLVRRDADGFPFEILRIPPEAVTILSDPATGEPWFKIAFASGAETVSHADMIHVPAPCTLDGITGIAPIQRAKNAISLALAMEAHASRIFAKGARPSGILSFPPTARLGGKGAENALASFEHQTAGDNSGRPAVLYDGATWTSLEYSTVDLQFSELRAAQTHEIARAFSVPPTLIGELAKATLSNSETMGRQFLTLTLMPWITTIRAAYRRVLLTRDERRAYSIDFVLDGLLRADSDKRAAFYAALRAAGVVTANEIRALENLPAHDDGNSLASPHTTANTAPAPETPVV